MQHLVVCELPGYVQDGNDSDLYRALGLASGEHEHPRLTRNKISGLIHLHHLALLENLCP